MKITNKTGFKISESLSEELIKSCSVSNIEEIVIVNDSYVYDNHYFYRTHNNKITVVFGVNNQCLTFGLNVVNTNDKNIKTFNTQNKEVLLMDCNKVASKIFRFENPLLFTSGLYFTENGDMVNSELTSYGTLCNRLNIILDKNNPYEDRYFNTMIVSNRSNNHYRLQVSENEVNEENLKTIINIIKNL